MFEYQLVRARRKTISLCVFPDGRIQIRAPYHVTLAEVRKFASGKEDWVARCQQKNEERKIRARSAFRLQAGGFFPYMGKKLIMQPVKNIRISQIRGDEFIYPEEADPVKSAELFLKQAGRAEIERRVAEWSEKTGLIPSSIRQSSARGRWGSCSIRGSVNFSWRLLMAPEELIDYVIVHELAHIRHPDHSPAFWRTVCSILPDAPSRRKALKNMSELMEQDFTADSHIEK